MTVKLLVIDDDDMVRATMKLLLEGAGYEVTVARGGKEAVRAFRREPADAVLCDLFMPELDGLEVMRDLRRSSPGVPVVAMSGGGRLGYVDVLEMARYLGAAGPLAKPFGRAELLASVREALLREALGGCADGRTGGDRGD